MTELQAESGQTVGRILYKSIGDWEGMVSSDDAHQSCLGLCAADFRPSEQSSLHVMPGLPLSPSFFSKRQL